jgi:hypothetical protein
LSPINAVRFSAETCILFDVWWSEKKRIRILFSVTSDFETSEIFVIADRRDDEVYKIAAQRLAKLDE